MKKLLLLFAFGIFLIILISAQEIPTYPQGQSIQLTAVCDNCTQVNLTQVTFPNGTFALLGEFSMTKNGSNYNYTFSNTNTLGTYKYVTCGDLNGIRTCEDTVDREFEITPSGVTINTAESILYIVLILINLLIFCFFLYWAIKFPYGNVKNEQGEITKVTKTKYLKLLSTLFAYGSFYWFFAIFTGIVNNFINLEVFRSLISNAYIVLSGMGVGFTVLIFIIIFVEAWRDIIFNKEIKKYGKALIKG